FMLSLGAQNRATDSTDSKDDMKDPAPSPTKDGPTPFRPGESSNLPINSHKITLYSANTRKRKPRRGDDHPEDGGQHTRRPTFYPHAGPSLASLGALASSAYGGLGAVLYS